MEHDWRVKDKDKNELLSNLLEKSGQIGSKAYEQVRMGILVRCTEDIEAAIRHFTDSNNKLSNRLLWLNIILGFFTVAGAFIAVLQIIK